jgi:hypothetical protein
MKECVINFLFSPIGFKVHKKGNPNSKENCRYIADQNKQHCVNKIKFKPRCRTFNDSAVSSQIKGHYTTFLTSQSLFK